jgi:hypothetical protein
MANCSICGEPLPDGARACTVCGTSVNDALPQATIVASPASAERTHLLAVPDVPANGRFCPSCRKVYGPEYSDSFCSCGVELLRPPPPPPPGVAEIAPPVPAPPPATGRPAAGTPFLTLFGKDRQPLAYFPLTRDATLIGRLDALAGVFPDVDLDAHFEPAVTRKVSRQHALILRHRVNRSFSLRPLAGNTGTQLETEMVLPLQDYPLPPGSRLILGGAVRLKFEIA